MLFLLNLVTTVVLVTKKRRFYLNLVFNLVKRTFSMCFFYRGNEFGPLSPGCHPYRAWGTFFYVLLIKCCFPTYKFGRRRVALVPTVTVPTRRQVEKVPLTFLEGGHFHFFTFHFFIFYVTSRFASIENIRGIV